MAFQRVKQFKDIELSYDSPAAVTVKFYTDMTAGVQGPLALQKSLNFPATSGRQTLALPLDTSGPATYVEGTLYRVEVTGAGVVRLYGGLVRARAIGVWFNGASTPPESWSSSEQGIGI